MKQQTGPSGFLVINKPAGITSFDVIRECRRILGIRKLGHSGVLDKPAMGVLVIGANKATRLFEFFGAFEKEYIGDMWLGLTTSTDDLAGELTALSGRTTAERDAVEAALAAYTGEIDQIPPAFSLTKLGGRELYRYALEGREVEVEPKRVEILDYEVLEFDEGADPADYLPEGSRLEPSLEEIGRLTRIRARWRCRGGVYVRSIARDVGADLGTLSSLGYLLRTRVGPFRLEDALSLDELALRADSGEPLDKLFLPLSSIAPMDSQIALDATQLSMARNGQVIRRFRQQLPPAVEKRGDMVYGMDPASELAVLFSVGATNQQGLVELKPEKVLG